MKRAPAGRATLVVCRTVPGRAGLLRERRALLPHLLQRIRRLQEEGDRVNVEADAIALRSLRSRLAVQPAG